MVFVSAMKDIVDRVATAVPDPDGDTVTVVKYNVKLDGNFRGKYIAIVVPEGFDSNPTTRARSEPVYMISVYCMYFKNDSESFLAAREKFLSWADKVFDAYHLQVLGGYVEHIEANFKMSSGEFGDLKETVIRGVVLLNIRKAAFTSN